MISPSTRLGLCCSRWSGVMTAIGRVCNVTVTPWAHLKWTALCLGWCPEKRRSAMREATVHLGCTLNEIAVSERLAWQGDRADESFVLVVQPSLFDSSQDSRNRAYALGVLPCTKWVGIRYERKSRNANRVFCSGFPQSDACAQCSLTMAQI